MDQFTGLSANDRKRAICVWRQHFGGKTDQVTMTPQTLIVAGWTGRDEQALRKHIRELEEIGVKAPKSTPGSIACSA